MRTIAHCYLSDNPYNRVLVSLTEHEVGRDVAHRELEIRCCCFCLYYNKKTSEFAVHCRDKGDPADWIELPWDEWVDVENPDDTKTFSYQAKTFANRVLGGAAFRNQAQEKRDRAAHK